MKILLRFKLTRENNWFKHRIMFDTHVAINSLLCAWIEVSIVRDAQRSLDNRHNHETQPLLTWLLLWCRPLMHNSIKWHMRCRCRGIKTTHQAIGSPQLQVQCIICTTKSEHYALQSLVCAVFFLFRNILRISTTHYHLFENLGVYFQWPMIHHESKWV